MGREFRDGEIVLRDYQRDGTCGIPGPRTIEAIRHLAAVEVVIPDPAYEGKSIAAFIDFGREVYFPSGLSVVHAHLGGQPVLSAHMGDFTSRSHLLDLNKGIIGLRYGRCGV